MVRVHRGGGDRSATASTTARPGSALALALLILLALLALALLVLALLLLALLALALTLARWGMTDDEPGTTAPAGFAALLLVVPPTPTPTLTSAPAA
jgi:hypothetical protein